MLSNHETDRTKLNKSQRTVIALSSNGTEPLDLRLHARAVSAKPDRWEMAANKTGRGVVCTGGEQATGCVSRFEAQSALFRLRVSCGSKAAFYEG